MNGALSDESEEHLVEQARRGERAAYAELVRRHYDGVIGAVYRMCGQAQTAEDAAQEAFLKAWLALPSFQPRAAFRSWLYRIAINTALDALRRRPASGLDEQENVLADPTPGPEAALLAREQAERVQRAVLALPPAARSVLVLREYSGLSYSEISLALDIPPGTVMSRLNYARSLLRKELEWYPNEQEHAHA